MTKLSRKLIQSTSNSHSNHLRRWIGLIHIECESVQCAFHVDAINAHYFCCVDRPFVFFASNYDSRKLHVWKLINHMVLMLLSHQTVKALLTEWEYWAEFTPV